jgi:hypothetical protein
MQILNGQQFLQACSQHMRVLSDSRVVGQGGSGVEARYIVCEPDKTNVGLGNRL